MAHENKLILGANMTITRYKATEGRMVDGERVSVYFVQKKTKKNEINRKNRKMQLENKQKRLPQGASAIHTYTRT